MASVPSWKRGKSRAHQTACQLFCCLHCPLLVCGAHDMEEHSGLSEWNPLGHLLHCHSTFKHGEGVGRKGREGEGGIFTMLGDSSGFPSDPNI